MDQEERIDRIETSKNLSQIVEGVAGNSKNSMNGVVSETAIAKNLEENGYISAEIADFRLQNDGFGSRTHPEVEHGIGICHPLGQNDTGNTGNSSSSVEGSVLEDEERDMGVKSNGMVSSRVSVESSEGLINEETNEVRGVVETSGPADQGSSGNSDNSVDGFVVETIIVINNQEAACLNGSNGVLEVKDDGLGSDKVLAERPTTKVAEAEGSCVIDIDGNGGGRRQFKESCVEEKICRICHLNSEQSHESVDSMSTTAAAVNLIQLGCGCKDELGIAHSHCAEAWFKLKGNRMCEICGQTAKNITGVGDNRFIEDWHGQGSTSGGVRSSNRGAGCWRGQPFCNFLMACLVIAFVLPWFFRVNMF